MAHLLAAPAPAIPVPGAIFFFNIQSVTDVVHAAPPLLGPFNLDRRVNAGDNLDFEVLLDAQALVEYIRTRLPQLQVPGVSLEVIFLVAGVRLEAIRSAFVSSLFYPQLLHPLVLALQHGFLALRGEVQQLRATVKWDMYNKLQQRLNRTRHEQGSRILPMRKWIPGHGLVLANHLLPGNFPALINPPLGAIGEVPGNFNPEIHHYGDGEILWLVMFYRESFGIFPNDNLAVRRQKLWQFFVV